MLNEREAIAEVTEAYEDNLSTAKLKQHAMMMMEREAMLEEMEAIIQAGSSNLTVSGNTTNSDVDSTTEASGNSNKTSSGISNNSNVDSTTEASSNSIRHQRSVPSMLKRSQNSNKEDPFVARSIYSLCGRVSMLEQEIFPLVTGAADVGLADVSVLEAAWTIKEDVDHTQSTSQERHILILRGKVTLLEKFVDELNRVYDTKWQSEAPKAVEWDIVDDLNRAYDTKWQSEAPKAVEWHLPEGFWDVHVLGLRLNRLEEQANHLSDRDDQARSYAEVLLTRGHSYNEKSLQHCTSIFCWMRNNVKVLHRAMVE